MTMKASLLWSFVGFVLTYLLLYIGLIGLTVPYLDVNTPYVATIVLVLLLDVLTVGVGSGAILAYFIHRGLGDARSCFPGG